MDKRAYYRKKDVAQQYEGIRFSGVGGQRTHAIECEAISSLFSMTELLLDVACGTGRVLRGLKEQGRNVLGVDQSEQMLEQSHTRDLFVQGNVFHLPFKSHSFDGAYCLRFTNHYQELAPLLTEVHRILKPGGCFVFDAMRWSPLIWNHWGVGGKNYFHSPSKVQSLLKNIGFQVVGHSPLFIIGPYLMAGFPGRWVDWIQKFKRVIPWPSAVEVWHVRKK